MASTVGAVTYGIAYGAKVSTAVGIMGMVFTCIRPFFPLLVTTWPQEGYDFFDFDFGLSDQRTQTSNWHDTAMHALGLEIPAWISTSVIGILSSTIGCLLRLNKG